MSNTTAASRGILFSDQMSLAIRSGRKTQTRRMVTPQPNQVPTLDDQRLIMRQDPISKSWVLTYPGVPIVQAMQAGHGWINAAFGKCPYGVPGDRLWVRETHYRFGHWESIPGAKTKGGRMKWAFIPDTDEIRFDRPEACRNGRHHKDSETPAWHKRLGRFMPRSASRITLEITSIGAERLHQINALDALAEGFLGVREVQGTLRESGDRETTGKFIEGCPRDGFIALWDQLNGSGSWDNNPWVWVVGLDVLKGARHG